MAITKKASTLNAVFGFTQWHSCSSDFLLLKSIAKRKITYIFFSNTNSRFQITVRYLTRKIRLSKQTGVKIHRGGGLRDYVLII